jgi:hypothetical protein
MFPAPCDFHWRPGCKNRVIASCASSSVHASAGSPAPPICGVCDRRFEPVREAFAANFTERDEYGAAVCVMISGQVVADLYGAGPM